MKCLLLVSVFCVLVLLLPSTLQNPVYCATNPTMNEILSKTFERVQTTPIMTHGVSGSWESNVIGGEFVIDDGTQLVMYYLGSTGPVCAIGRATAPRTEPPTSWTKYSGNPVLTAGSSGWDASTAGIRCGSVVKVGSSYYLYYSPEQSGAQGIRAQVGVAMSSDGINFVKYSGNPILTPDTSIGDYHCAIPCVINVGGTFYMYYTSSSDSGFWTPNQYRVASSTDGLHWTKLGVILNVGSSGQWDGRFIEQFKVYQASDGYVLVYEGYSGLVWSVGAATSSNPAGPFTKFSGNPIFSKSGVYGTFDETHVATPFLFRMTNNLYLFYQGTGNSGNYNVAYWDNGLAAISLSSGSQNPTVTVTTWDDRGGVSFPIGNVAVTVRKDGSAYATWTTNSLGTYEETVEPGTYDFSANWQGLVDFESVTLLAGDSKSIDLRFGSGNPFPFPFDFDFRYLFFIGIGAFAGVLAVLKKRLEHGHGSRKR